MAFDGPAVILVETWACILFSSVDKGNTDDWSWQLDVSHALCLLICLCLHHQR